MRHSPLLRMAGFHWPIDRMGSICYRSHAVQTYLDQYLAQIQGAILGTEPLIVINSF